MRSDLQSVATAFVEILLTNAEARNAYSAATQSHNDAAAASVVNRFVSPVPPVAATDMPDLAPLVAAGLAARSGAKSATTSTETSEPGDVGGSGASVMGETGEPGDVGGSGASVMGDTSDASGTPKDEVEEADGGGSATNVMRDKEVDEDDKPAE